MKEYKVRLSNRNKKVYDKVDEKFKNSNFAVVESAVGTGKSYIGMELIARNSSKNMLYLAPTNALLDDFKRKMASEGLLGDGFDKGDLNEIDKRLKDCFPSLEFHTYSWFHRHQTAGDLKDVNYDYVITDECHHTGAEKWGLSFNEYIDNHKDTKFLGLSATFDREDGYKTIYDRKDVVYSYSLAEAIVDGVYDSEPIYVDVSTLYLNKIIESVKTIENEFPDGPEKKELIKEYNNYIRNINKDNKETKEIIKKYIKKGDRVLYFCPSSRKIGSSAEEIVEEVEEIEKIILEAENLFSDIDRDFKLYKSYSKYDGSAEDEASFASAGRDNLSVMYVKRRYDEGVRPGGPVDDLIMGNGVWSYGLFQQKFGRCLQAGDKSNRNPVIIDLVGNINYYKRLKEDVERVIKEKENRSERHFEQVEIDKIMSKFKLVDKELSSVEMLKKLETKINERRKVVESTFIIEMVNRIEQFCYKYGVYPLTLSVGRLDKDNVCYKECKDLRRWLKSINLEDNADKYKEIILSNGENVYDKLVYLSRKYNLNVIKCKLIRAYCKKYNWPFIRQEDVYMFNPPNNSILSAFKINPYDFLLKSNFYDGKDNFKYKDIVDETGKSLYDFLKECYDEYALKSLEDIKKIMYKEVDKELSNRKIINFLNDCGLIATKKKPRKLFDISCFTDVYEQIKNKVSNYVTNKSNIPLNNIDRDLFYVNILKNYCDTNRTFLPKTPSILVYNKESEKKINYNVWDWLINSGLLTDDYKNPDLRDKSGRLVVDIVNDLIKKYTSNGSIEFNMIPYPACENYLNKIAGNVKKITEFLRVMEIDSIEGWIGEDDNSKYSFNFKSIYSSVINNKKYGKFSSNEEMLKSCVLNNSLTLWEKLHELRISGDVYYIIDYLEKYYKKYNDSIDSSILNDIKLLINFKYNSNSCTKRDVIDALDRVKKYEYLKNFNYIHTFIQAIPLLKKIDKIENINYEIVQSVLKELYDDKDNMFYDSLDDMIKAVSRKAVNIFEFEFNSQNIKELCNKLRFSLDIKEYTDIQWFKDNYDIFMYIYKYKNKYSDEITKEVIEATYKFLDVYYSNRDIVHEYRKLVGKMCEYSDRKEYIADINDGDNPFYDLVKEENICSMTKEDFLKYIKDKDGNSLFDVFSENEMKIDLTYLYNLFDSLVNKSENTIAFYIAKTCISKFDFSNVKDPNAKAVLDKIYGLVEDKKKKT